MAHEVQMVDQVASVVQVQADQKVLKVTMAPKVHPDTVATLGQMVNQAES